MTFDRYTSNLFLYEILHDLEEIKKINLEQFIIYKKRWSFIIKFNTDIFKGRTLKKEREQDQAIVVNGYFGYGDYDDLIEIFRRKVGSLKMAREEWNKVATELYKVYQKDRSLNVFDIDIGDFRYTFFLNNPLNLPIPEYEKEFLRIKSL